MIGALMVLFPKLFGREHAPCGDPPARSFGIAERCVLAIPEPPRTGSANDSVDRTRQLYADLHARLREERATHGD